MSNAKQNFIRTFELSLKVLSPCHIGVEKEKAWLKESDFLIIKDKVKLIKQKIFLRYLYKNKQAALSEADLASIEKEEKGALQNLLEYHSELRIREENLEKINPFIRNGLWGVYIPGSAIKGAIRTAIYKSQRNGLDKNEETYFGDIENSVFKNLMVRDFIPNEELVTEIYGCKILSRKIGRTNDKIDKNKSYYVWKNGKKNSTEVFDEKNFINYYECIKPDSLLKGSLSLRLEQGRDKTTIERYKNCFGGFEENFIANLFHKINTLAVCHLKREWAYYLHLLKKSKFEEKQLIEQNIKDFMTTWLEKITLAMTEKSSKAYLRLGQGLGKHWLRGENIDNHINTLLHKKEKLKTRKIFFQQIGNNKQGFLGGWVEITYCRET